MSQKNRILDDYDYEESVRKRREWEGILYILSREGAKQRILDIKEYLLDYQYYEANEVFDKFISKLEETWDEEDKKEEEEMGDW